MHMMVAMPDSGSGSVPNAAPLHADPAIFRMGMRRLASGVCLVATLHDGKRHGLIATSVSSLSEEPPSLIVCVNKSSSSHLPLRQVGFFSVNLLGVQHAEIGRQFSNSQRRHERFSTGEWLALSNGVPVLQNALAAFDCRIDRTIDYATHSIFIAIVEGIRMAEDGLDPMIHFNTEFKRLLAAGR